MTGSKSCDSSAVKHPLYAPETTNQCVKEGAAVLEDIHQAHEDHLVTISTVGLRGSAGPRVETELQIWISKTRPGSPKLARQSRTLHTIALGHQGFSQASHKTNVGLKSKVPLKRTSRTYTEIAFTTTVCGTPAGKHCPTLTPQPMIHHTSSCQNHQTTCIVLTFSFNPQKEGKKPKAQAATVLSPAAMAPASNRRLRF